MIKKLLSLSLLCLSYVGFAQNCNDKYLTPIFDSVTVETVKFGEAINGQGNNQELFMDIYQGKGDTASNRPVLIFAFGGSFITGSRTSDELVYFASRMAAKGFVCASIDYRLGQITDLGAEEGLVKTVFRAVQDGKAAVRYFRQDADTDNNYRINPATIFTGGTSAGAILMLHLAYMDDPMKLPVQWQTWLGELGGLEGSSGNPGYCSKSNGVFSFSGGVADTAWIETDDVPVYSVHSTQDGVVLYNYGRPIGGNAPIELYGSGLITPRMGTLEVHAVLDTYQDDTHPSFLVEGDPQETARRLDSTELHLTEFLHNILPCNENNLIQPNQDQCQSFASVEEILGFEQEEFLYPNPASDKIYLKDAKFTSYKILDLAGRIVKDGRFNAGEVSIETLPNGLYIMELEDGRKQRFIKR